MGARAFIEKIHGRSGGLALAALVAAFGAASCAKRPAPAPALAVTPAPAPEEAQGEGDNHVHGAGKTTKFRETAVYLDGKVISVMRCSELPPSLKPQAVPAINGLDVPRFYSLHDYVAALGVDLSKLRAVQLYGSHARVATIEGDELESYKDKLYFDYTQQVTGKPRARWYFRGLRNTTYIDQILAVTIYVDKPAPKFSPRTGLAFEDGTRVDGIPYTTEDPPRGTRVYVDGVLAGAVKRKMLTDGIIAKGSDRVFPKFSFAAFIQSLGVDAKRAKTIDFISNDSLVARVDARTWMSEKDAFVFTTPRHTHGKVKASFPGDNTAGVSSVQLFVRSTPPTRHIDPEAFDSKNGSEENRDGAGNARNDDGSEAAQGVNWQDQEE